MKIKYKDNTPFSENEFIIKVIRDGNVLFKSIDKLLITPLENYLDEYNKTSNVKIISIL